MDLQNAAQLATGFWASVPDFESLLQKNRVKALVISDSHFNKFVLNAVLTAFSDADALLFCGDGIGDIVDNAHLLPGAVSFVRGNNDPGTYPFAFGSRLEQLKIPRVVSVSIADCPIVMTHGDSFSFFDSLNDSIDFAKTSGAKVVLFGHSHRGCFLQKDGILALNPGSISRPRGCPASFAVLDFVRGKPLPDFTFYKIDAAENAAPFCFRPFIPKEFVDDWLL